MIVYSRALLSRAAIDFCASINNDIYTRRDYYSLSNRSLYGYCLALLFVKFLKIIAYIVSIYIPRIVVV